MVQRTFTVAILLVLIPPAAAEDAPGYEICSGTSLQKILRDNSFTGPIAQTVELDCARNEYEGFQTWDDCAAMRRKGKELWWYANYRFYIPLSAVHHRMIFWLTRKYGLDGFLYWGTVFWVPNLEIGPDIATDLFDYTNDPEKLYQRRKQIAELLERM